MYRALVMFPKSAAPVEIEALIEGIASSFKTSAEGLLITRSEGPLMGPGAKAGEAACVLEADFVALEDAMTAIQAEDFPDVKTRTETLGCSIFLFEFRDV